MKESDAPELRRYKRFMTVDKTFFFVNFEIMQHRVSPQLLTTATIVLLVLAYISVVRKNAIINEAQDSRTVTKLFKHGVTIRSIEGVGVASSRTSSKLIDFSKLTLHSPMTENVNVPQDQAQVTRSKSGSESVSGSNDKSSNAVGTAPTVLASPAFRSPAMGQKRVFGKAHQLQNAPTAESAETRTDAGTHQALQLSKQVDITPSVSPPWPPSDELMNTRNWNITRNRTETWLADFQPPTGIAARCDILIIKPKTTFYHKPLPQARTIYVSSVLRGLGIVKLNALLEQMKPEQRVVVVLASADDTFPNSIDKRMQRTSPRQKKFFLQVINNPKLAHLFVENLDERIRPDKVSSLPLGVNPIEGPVNTSYYLQFANTDIMRKPLKFTMFNRIRNQRQFLDRRTVRERAERHWKAWKAPQQRPTLDELQPRAKREAYLSTLSKFAFTICEHGGGLDPNPKVWEAILMGTIPIVRRSPMTYVFEEEGLPVVVVEDWKPTAISEERLVHWRVKFAPFFTDPVKRQATLEKLTLDHWMRKIIGKLSPPS